MTMTDRREPLQLMILGTGPAAAKTCITLGLSKLLRHRGVRVAPFKAIAVISPAAMPAGVDRSHPAPGVVHPIGAIDIPPEAVMNPVAVWDIGEERGEIVVMGETIGTVELLNRDAIRYDRLSAKQKTQISDAIRAAYQEIRSRFEAIIIEGAGSPIEAPEEDDWSNQRVLRMSGAPALLVTRFSTGGAAAALVGTLTCLAPDLRRRIVGLVLSDVHDREAALHAASLATKHSGLPVLGVIPHLRHGVNGTNKDYSVAYRAWADALAAHLDLRILGDQFAVPA